MNEIVLSTLKSYLTYFINLQNFLEYISDCFSESSFDNSNFSKTQVALFCLNDVLEALISDIQTGKLSFEYKK